MWSAQQPIHSTRTTDTWPSYIVNTQVQVAEDSQNPHFSFNVAKYPADADMEQSSICVPGTHHDPGGGNTCPANPPDASGNVPIEGSARMDSNDMRPEQKLDWGKASQQVLFAVGSTTIDATARAVLDPVADTLKTTAGSHVELTGHASADHRRGVDVQTGATQNMDLARGRSAAVRDYLAAKGVSADAIPIRNAGELGATADNASDRSVDVQVGTHQTQNPALHETGHMLGLGDEYTAGGSSPGDPVSAGYAGMVKAQTGQDITQANDESAMSMGSTVRLAHDSSFLEALEAITGTQDWRL